MCLRFVTFWVRRNLCWRLMSCTHQQCVHCGCREGQYLDATGGSFRAFMEGNLESFPGTKAAVSCLSRPCLVHCLFCINLCPSCSKQPFFEAATSPVGLKKAVCVDNLWMHSGLLLIALIFCWAEYLNLHATHFCSLAGEKLDHINANLAQYPHRDAAFQLPTHMSWNACRNIAVTIIWSPSECPLDFCRDFWKPVVQIGRLTQPVYP